jgi:hypothetical protein
LREDEPVLGGACGIFCANAILESNRRDGKSGTVKIGIFRSG